MQFVVEAGSMHGGSAIRMAMELDKHNLKNVPAAGVWEGRENAVAYSALESMTLVESSALTRNKLQQLVPQ